MTEPEKIAHIFKVLSDGTRARIVNLLKHKTLCVNALANALEISPAAVSQHLRILRNMDIVTPIKRGYFVHYEINKATLEKWRKLAVNFLEIED